MINQEVHNNGLGEVCTPDEVLLSKNDYILASNECLSKFNVLRNKLTKEQLTFLFDYEESTAQKECVIINILSQ